MRYIQYLGPHDSIDMSNRLDRAGTVFYTPTTSLVPVDMRGNVLKVTNEQAEELLTYPGHHFVEVEDEKAKTLVEKQNAARKIREEQYALFSRDSDNMDALRSLAPSIDAQIAAIPTAGLPPAASAPATAHQIQAETRSGATATGAAAPTGRASRASSATPSTPAPAADGTEGGSAFVSTATTPTGE